VIISLKRIPIVLFFLLTPFLSGAQIFYEQKTVDYIILNKHEFASKGTKIAFEDSLSGKCTSFLTFPSLENTVPLSDKSPQKTILRVPRAYQYRKGKSKFIWTVNNYVKVGDVVYVLVEYSTTSSGYSRGARLLFELTESGNVHKVHIGNWIE
jgi:hypothetical protein